MKHYSISRYFKPLALLTFLVVVVFLGVWASKQRQDIRKEAAINAVNLLIVPQTNGGEVLTTNSQFTREIVIQNPSGVQIANYELTLSFPASLLEVVSLDASMSPLPTDVLSTYDNTSGTVRLTRVDIGQTPTTQTSFTIARIVFKAKVSSGTANVNFTQNIVSGIVAGSTQVVQLSVDSIQNGTYTLSTGATPTTGVPTATSVPGVPTHTPTRTPTPSPTAIITTIPTTIFLNTTTFSLHGRDYPGASQNLPAFVSIKNTNNEWSTTITNGVISNLPLTNTSTGPAIFIIRPEGYLSREVTQTLVTGQNTLSLAGIIFCAGDIDGSGLVNSLDYSTLLGDYGGSSGKSDLDGSGYVNSLDFSLLLSNFLETPATQECE